MTSHKELNPIGEAQGRITRLEDRRIVLLSELSDARARRDLHSRDYLLNGGASHNGWANSVADETKALALLADVDALLPVLNGELARAEAGVRAANNKANRSAFAARLAVVVRERSIFVPSGEEATFAANAEAAYRWLATMLRTAGVDRTRYFTHWLDAMTTAGHGSVSRAELLAAAYVHGDIVVMDGGDAWNTFLGINQYTGREAQSVSFDSAPVGRASAMS